MNFNSKVLLVFVLLAAAAPSAFAFRFRSNVVRYSYVTRTPICSQPGYGCLRRTAQPYTLTSGYSYLAPQTSAPMVLVQPQSVVDSQGLEQLIIPGIRLLQTHYQNTNNSRIDKLEKAVKENAEKIELIQKALDARDGKKRKKDKEKKKKEFDKPETLKRNSDHLDQLDDVRGKAVAEAAYWRELEAQRAARAMAEAKLAAAAAEAAQAAVASASASGSPGKLSAGDQAIVDAIEKLGKKIETLQSEVAKIPKK